MNANYLMALAGSAGVAAASGWAYRTLRQHATSRALAIDTPNRIVEEHFVQVGGIEQWLYIRGEDRDNPVLLILHGGPGWPNATFALPLRPCEEHFTLVQWDQRGAGKTLGRSGNSRNGEMTFEQRINDAIEVAEFLRHHLCQDKVILLAESMGTLTGLPLAKRRPDLFSAVVVTDLYVDILRNETLKYQLTLERARGMKDGKAVAALERIGGDPARWDLRAWNTNMALAFKTNMPVPNLDRRLLFPLLLSSPLYSLRDIYTLLSGFQSSTAQMFEEIKAFDARRLGARFEVPFYLFQGARDVITITSLAEEYFAEVEAPAKGLALLPDAGHFAAFSHPKPFLAELLAQVRPHAESRPFEFSPPANSLNPAVQSRRK